MVIDSDQKGMRAAAPRTGADVPVPPGKEETTETVPSAKKSPVTLPDGPQKERREMKKPKVLAPQTQPEPTRGPIKITLSPEAPIVLKIDEVGDVQELPTEEPARKGPRSLSLADDERRRLFLASKLAPFTGVMRLSDSNQILFCCPACHERIQCEESELGKEGDCPKCGGEFKLPDREGEGEIVLLHVDARRAQPEELPPLNLPDERAEDGPSNEAVFQAFDELLPEGEEGVLEWGLEKDETKSEPSKRMRWWAAVALVLFVFAAGFLLYNVWGSSGRSAATVGAGEEGAWMEKVAGGGVDWTKVPSARLFLLADASIRAFLRAPDIETKASVSRGGMNSLARMRAHYELNGGYEAETKAYGDVRDIEMREEREVGAQKFIMVRARFVDGATGMYALLKGEKSLEVDWDYAVGYGEMRLDKLVEERPSHPVLLRGYLKESRYFNGGFVVTGYRNFDLSDSTRARNVPVYVARGSVAEDVLREAWGDAVIGSIERGPTKLSELDCILRVRYENTEARSGFVIDEVLTRGWILPQLPP